MSIPHWRTVMEQEYHALMQNETWTLVPPPRDVNIIDSRWVFEVKKHGDAKGFKQRMDWIVRIHSARLSSLPLFGISCLWQFLVDGLSASLMCRMLFFMGCFKKRSTCGSHLDLLITLSLITFVV
ncbi:uncharacterized mitochondrial protein AtMg00820-like [Lolium perenne]|uniref:uncharacterized mitochondrial protein AtMg00820-like n=1 Tax=Lolium perenne TaxID=4522 RepID=UPI0021F58ABE|nr:uncharacterized mitochondrial protein AtMg00820-like [Lolium perenne]